MEKGPAFYVDGGTLNGRKFFSQVQLEEIAKWSHAIGESQKLGLPVSNMLRDVFPLNFLNPYHLAMQVKGQTLKDWIEADSKRGSLKPLIEGRLWTWSVPENRIASIRKVLGPARLLVSWGDFNTPSGGPIGDSYGRKPETVEPPKFSGLPLTAAERQWIEDGLDAVKPIVERYTGKKAKDCSSREPLYGDLLDTAFTAWSEDTRPDRPASDQALQAFAAALGDHLAHRFGMAWHAVEDEHGRSLGVAHRSKAGAQTWSYPVDAVAKRIERGETGFIAGIAQVVDEQIRRDQ